jgi:signal transduction histidine kinase
VGLGLALVKKIVEAHGSRVMVNSETGKGTLIEFQLPVTRPE